MPGSLSNLGDVASSQGDYPAALPLYEESLAIRKELGDKKGIADLFGSLGRAAYSRADYPAALSHTKRAWFFGRSWGIRTALPLASSGWEGR